MYSIHVGNVGNVWSGANPAQAMKEYGQWVALSRSGSGRAAGEEVTLSRETPNSVATVRHFDPQAGFYFAEITDTYGGEANYSWVRWYKVKASTMRGAIGKLSRDYGASFRKEYGDSEMSRYNARGMCVCAFVQPWDSAAHEHYSSYRTL